MPPRNTVRLEPLSATRREATASGSDLTFDLSQPAPHGLDATVHVPVRARVLAHGGTRRPAVRCGRQAGAAGCVAAWQDAAPGSTSTPREEAVGGLLAQRRPAWSLVATVATRVPGAPRRAELAGPATRSNPGPSRRRLPHPRTVPVDPLEPAARVRATTCRIRTPSAIGGTRRSEPRWGASRCTPYRTARTRAAGLMTSVVMSASGRPAPPTELAGSAQDSNAHQFDISDPAWTLDNIPSDNVMDGSVLHGKRDRGPARR
jgi:hypothetical protein